MDYSILEKDWNAKDSVIKKSSKIISNTTRLNNYLLKQKTNALDIINQLEDTGEIHNLSVNEIKSRITNKTAKIPFFIYTEKIIEEYRDMKKFGNARVYKSSLTALRTFRKDIDFPLHELNYNFLKRFESYCIKRRDFAFNIVIFFHGIYHSKQP